MKTKNTQLVAVPTAEEINKKALALSALGELLVGTGRSMMSNAVELGEMLEARRRHEDGQNPGSWQAWCIANLAFDHRHERRYRKLAAEKAQAIAEGREWQPALPGMELTSLRQAVALIAEGSEAQDGGKAAQAPTPPTKTAGIWARLWKVFREPKKVPEPERKEFVAHTAEAVRLCKENGWSLPGLVIDIQAEEVK